ncbi:outer membrane protein assembly factor [Anaeromyxobacter sp. Fw109-5]|uniref:BamA/OMP85 family outer membrane protein n=1 Tax=Anaeromyxobacter sp. (strain Fw109-5) TaxID=404589 RepID=UPI000158A45B|nr:BamA/TamA family outer membrane protein [Anaeromyxobacter sp. Fw109-5]ABS24391.1 surface antigen (D15) [Anaeromyxobacter sp. Fw109-5]
MVRRVALALLVPLALGATGCLRARGTESEPIVTELKLEGVEALDAEDIKAKLATQEPAAPGGVTGLVRREGFPLDPDALASDRRRVEAFYRDRGYYAARVDKVDVVPDGPGRARVVMHVVEGKPVRVTELHIKGLEEVAEARERLKELPLEVGDVFRVSAYDATKAAITRGLRTKGWANAEVTQAAQVLPQEGTAQVTYEVKAGRRFRFGPIFVAGTSAVSRDLVREQASVDVRTGAWFDESKLSKAQARVFNLGVFAGVRVTRGTPSAERGIIPVVVAVREAPFRTIRAGPGLGVEATRWEARGNASWQHRNLFGELRRFGIDLRAGYAWLPTPWADQRSGVVALIGFEFQQPAAIARRLDVSARVEVERGLELAYGFWAERVELGLPVRISPRWTFIPSYNLEVYQLSDAPEAVVTRPGTPEAETRPLLVGCPSSTCLLSYLEQRLAWDGRDDAVNTRRGYYVGLSLQEGFRIGTVGYRYLRFLPEVRGFWPLSRKLVLGARARVGALVPLTEPKEPPIVANFYSGGPLSMRGYYTRRLSPMIEVGKNDWVPVGGNGLFDGSLELRYALAGNWSGAWFLDAGNVAPPDNGETAWREALSLGDLQLASGVGLRYATPFGPIGVDVGVRLPTDLSSGVPFDKRFPPVPSNPNAGTAEHREPIVAVHITIGEAF